MAIGPELDRQMAFSLIWTRINLLSLFTIFACTRIGSKYQKYITWTTRQKRVWNDLFSRINAINRLSTRLNYGNIYMWNVFFDDLSLLDIFTVFRSKGRISFTKINKKSNFTMNWFGVYVVSYILRVQVRIVSAWMFKDVH